MNQRAVENVKVLVVEDEPDLLDAMVSFLQLEGFEAAGAGSTMAADAWMAQHEVDVVILDLGLPDKDGLAWLAEMERRDEKGIILATARGKLDDRLTGLGAGVDAYLVKPIELEEMVAIVRNIATRIERQKQAETSRRAKDQFLATVSHEMRTPLTAMLGSTELLSDEPLCQPQRQLVDQVKNSGELLLALANDVLDLSRIESGQLSLHELPVAVAVTVSETVAMLESTATAKHLLLRCEIDPFPPLLLCDPVRLQQVLVNLIGNAIKFTDRGTVTVRVEVAGRDEGSVKLRFSITDTGSGIAPEDMPKLFTPFTQIDASPRQRAAGSGLGLLITKRLLEAMGGEISVRSTVGQGSCFQFTLPMRFVEEASLEAAEATVRPRALSMLLVEDVIESAVVMEAMLRRDGHTVTTVESGLDALTLLERESFDLVLMDLQMPDIDGFETTRRLRRMSDPRKAQTPVFALTASVLRRTERECFEAGMDDVASKPLVMAELNAKLVARFGSAEPAAEVVEPRPSFVQQMGARFGAWSKRFR